jgi:hypothetical protein
MEFSIKAATPEALRAEFVRWLDMEAARVKSTKLLTASKRDHACIDMAAGQLEAAAKFWQDVALTA